MSQENCLGFPTSSDINQAVKPQKKTRGSKFWIYKVEGLYYLCSEIKCADQLHGFAYAKSRFAHGVAQVNSTSSFVSEILIL